MQHGEIDRPLHWKLEPAALKEILQHSLYACGLPKAPEGQVRPDLPDGFRLQLAPLEPLYDLDPLTEASQGPQEGVSASSGSELIQTSQGTQDVLDDTAFFPVILHHLEIAVGIGALDSDEHAVSYR
jgi:hypothetical protein